MKRLLLLLALALPSLAQTLPTITWKNLSGWTGGGCGWDNISRDPNAGGFLVQECTNGGTIYETNAFEFFLPTPLTPNGLTINIVGTASTFQTAPADLPFSYGGANPGGLPNRPADRHPVGQDWVDTKRNLRLIAEGVEDVASQGVMTVSGMTGTSVLVPFATDGSLIGARIYVTGSANCPNAGTYCTITAVASSSSITLSPAPGNITNAAWFFVDPGNGTTQGVRQDMYEMSLAGGSPAGYGWTRLFPATLPTGTSAGFNVGYQGTVRYDPVDDLYVWFEGGCVFFYANTAGNSGGGLNAAQTAAGMSAGNTWVEVFSGGTTDSYPGVAWDTTNHIFWVYSGSHYTNNISAFNPGGSTRLGTTSHQFKAFCTAGACSSSAPSPGFNNNCDGGCNWVAFAWVAGAINNPWFHSVVANCPNAAVSCTTQDPGGSAGDYIWNPALGTDGMWVTIQAGSGPVGNNGSAIGGVAMDYDPVTNSLVTHGIDGIWQGQISGSLAVPLKVQETLFAADLTGTSMTSNVLTYGGIARTNEPWCQGVPIADSAAIVNTNYFTLSGESFGQFRILEWWPDGYAKWIKACGILPSLAAGTTASVTLSNTGTALTSVGTNNLPNPAGGAGVSDTTGYGYGGANMATDNGSTITVSTNGGTCVSGSAICFTVKKANFNVVDIQTIGSTTIVPTSSSPTRGIVLTGPAATGTATAITAAVGPYTIATGVNDVLKLAANSANPTTVTLAAGTNVTAATIAGEISVSGLTASASGGALVLTASTTGRAGNIQVSQSDALATFGLVAGGYSGAVTCSGDPAGTTCGTIYSSANDSSSTCVIEENGPVFVALRCQGSHKDASGNPYMQFTAREYFYRGKSDMKLTVTLRNAAYSVAANPSADCNYNSVLNICNGGSYDTSAKGIRAYELRLQTNSQITNYAIGVDSTQCSGVPCTGSLGSGDSAYIYQGTSNWMVPSAPDESYCGPANTGCPEFYTVDTGYVAKKNTTSLASGNASAYAPGFCDGTDSGSNGIEAGIDEFAAMWPASCEIYYANSEVRLGLLSGHNSKSAVYMPWPMWKIFEAYLSFHAGALASETNSFLKQQHFLAAAPSIAYMNSTAVWPYPLISGPTEDAFYTATQAAASPSLALSRFCFQGFTTDCTPDRGMANNEGQIGEGLTLGIYRLYAWEQGGSLNQEPFRWFDLMKFVQRGYAGRLLNSRYFYRYLNEFHWGHSDGTSASDNTINGFTWRSRARPEIDQTLGSPYQQMYNCPDSPNCAQQINYALEFGLAAGSVQWQNYLHEWTADETEYYAFTGDESVKEAMVPEKDYYLNTSTVAYGLSSTDNFTQTRGFATWIKANSVFAQYSTAIGASSDATAFLASGQHQFDSYINVESCESGIRPGGSTATWYPLGCAHYNTLAGDVGDGGSPGWVPGMSLERGNHQTNALTNGFCATYTGTDSGLIGTIRNQSPFIQSILADALFSFKAAKGPSWVNYNRAGDLAYGLALNNMLESLNDDGQTHWSDGTVWFNGMAYERLIDYANVCPPGTTNADSALVSYGSFGTALYDVVSVPNGDQNIYPTILTLTNETGDASTWSRIFKILVQLTAIGSSSWPGDFGMPFLSASIYNLNNPPVNTLQPVTPTCLNCSGATTTYQLQYTTPLGTCTNDPGCVRVKWSARQIRPFNQLLGYDPMNTGKYTYDPSVYQPWFGSNNAEATSAIPVATPTVTQTVSVVTGTTGLAPGNFTIHVMAPFTCTISPTAPGPYTNTQVISVTMTASNCGSGTLTWTSSGLPTGSSGCNSVIGTSCTISGTLSAAGSFPVSIAVTDGGSNTASINPTVIVNTAPSFTTSSPLPASTQGLVYSQTLVTTGGTSPVTCSISTGTLSGSGLTLNSNCTITGTSATPATYSFTALATDLNSITGNRAFSLIIHSSSPAASDSISLADAAGIIHMGVRSLSDSVAASDATSALLTAVSHAAVLLGGSMLHGIFAALSHYVRGVTN